MFAAQDMIRSFGGKVVESISLPSFDEIISAMPDTEYMEDLNSEYPYGSHPALIIGNLAYGLRKNINGWLANFDGRPQILEELIEFNTLEGGRDCTTTKAEFERNLKAFREMASRIVKNLLKEYEADVIIGPCDSRTGSVGSSSDFSVANLPLGFADFDGRGFGLHMLAPKVEEAKMLPIMAA
ncbi:hypothetical protein MMC25_007086 [Agyrium rufum]|nr:hypothetical protein [Agyrium rufum]